MGKNNDLSQIVSEKRRLPWYNVGVLIAGYLNPHILKTFIFNAFNMFDILMMIIIILKILSKYNKYKSACL